MSDDRSRPNRDFDASELKEEDPYRVVADSEELEISPSRLATLSNEQIDLLADLHDRIQFFEGKGWDSAAQLAKVRKKELTDPNYKSKRITERIETLEQTIERKEEYNRPTDEPRRRLREWSLGRLGREDDD